MHFPYLGINRSVMVFSPNCMRFDQRRAVGRSRSPCRVHALVAGIRPLRGAVSVGRSQTPPLPTGADVVQVLAEGHAHAEQASAERCRSRLQGGGAPGPRVALRWTTVGRATPDRFGHLLRHVKEQCPATETTLLVSIQRSHALQGDCSRRDAGAGNTAADDCFPHSTGMRPTSASGTEQPSGRFIGAISCPSPPRVSERDVREARFHLDPTTS